jgi:predicted HAD superfamily hydrolase
MNKISIFLDNFGKYDYEKLRKKVDNFEYVSFDVFDTLIKRDVPRPRDVFKVIEKNHSVNNFYRNRILAENIARRRLSFKKDVNLDDIYHFFPTKNDDIKYLEDLEIKTELNICTKNLEMVKFYDYCRKNKKIIIISDMYLPKAIISEILEKNGFTGYQELFVSNESNRIKADGSLFNYALKRIGNKKILHIGNSFNADYKPALKESKIKSYKVPTKFYRILQRNKYFLCNNSVEVEEKNFLDSFINNHVRLKNYYEYIGFKNLGPILCGFVVWLHNQLKNKKSVNCLFLARDSRIIKDAYELLYPEDSQLNSFKNFVISRRAVLVPSYYIFHMSYREIINSLPVPRVTTMAAVFDALGLDIDKYLDKVKKYGFKREERINRLRDEFSNRIEFKNLFNEVENDIVQNSRKEAASLCGYLNKFDFSDETILIDLGWNGTIQNHVSKILDRYNIKYNSLEGRYIGLAKGSKKLLEAQSAQSYLFDNLNNENECELELPFIGLLETFFLERTGSVKNYSIDNHNIKINKYGYEYENYSDEIKAIQEGALDFITEMKSSELFEYLSFYKNVVFENMYNLGCNPSCRDIDHFKKIYFLTSGEKFPLIILDDLAGIINKHKIYDDYSKSQWKIGFLKNLFKLNLNYKKIYKHFNTNISNNQNI